MPKGKVEKYTTANIRMGIPTISIANNIDFEIAEIMQEEAKREIMSMGCFHKRADIDPLNPFRTIESDYKGY